MRVTTKGRYALRAMTNLAASDSTQPKAIKVIAAEENISPEFLEQIFFKLKKADIISSVRGPGGGFVLHKSPASISVKMIFEAVDEGIDLTPCTSCTDDDEPMCTRIDTCLVYDVWREASERIRNYFDGITLQSILDKTSARAASLLADSEITIN